MIAQFIAHLILPNKKKNPIIAILHAQQDPTIAHPISYFKIIKHFAYKNPSVVIQGI
jgi:hypothetical protein